MSDIETSLPCRDQTAVATAVRIPLTVLASIPEKMRVLAEAIKIAAKAPDDEFRTPHNAVRSAYNSVNGSTAQAVNSFGELQSLLTTTNAKAAYTAAVEAKALVNAIYKASGNIHNDDCFKETFHDQATLDATVTALQECGGMIRSAVRPFGY